MLIHAFLFDVHFDYTSVYRLVTEAGSQYFISSKEKGRFLELSVDFH